MAQLPLPDAIQRFKENEDRVDLFTNGTAAEVVTPNNGNPSYPTQAGAADKLANAGGMIGAPTLTALQAITPIYNSQLGLDESTGALYRWTTVTVPPSWVSTGKNLLNDARVYADGKFTIADNNAKNYVKIPRDVSQLLINKSPDLSIPKFGDTSPPSTGSNVAVGTYVLLPAASTSTTIKRFSTVAAVVNAEFEIRVYTRSGDTFTLKSTIGKLKTYKTGLNEFNSYDFNEFTLAANDYVAITVLTNGASIYNGSSTDDKYYSNSYIGQNPFTGTAGKFNLKFAFYENNGSERAKVFIDYIDRISNESEVNFANILTNYTSTIGLAATPSLRSGNNNGVAHDVVGKAVSGFGTVSTIEVYSHFAGAAQVGVYSRNGSVFTRKRFQDVTLAVGLNTIPISLAVSNGEYVGLLTRVAGQIAYSTNSVGHDGMFTSSGTWTDNEFTSGTPNPAMTWDYQLRFTLTLKSLASNISAKKWLGLKYVSFGDSITWYNGRTYLAGQVEAGQLVKGYQSYLVDSLGCTLDNKGESGWTLPSIYAQRILPYDFTDVYAVSITSGANDHKNSVAVGEVMPINSTFNTNTYAGALQASIEKVISSNKATKIFLITPIKGFYSQETADAITGEMHGQTLLSKRFADVMIEIGKLYSVVVIDWYYQVGINELNKYYFLGDDPLQVPQYTLHPQNKGYQRMGEIVLSVMKNY